MNNKTARLEARLTSQNHTVIQYAAALRGQSVTDFVVAASLAEAQRTITENEVISLTMDDQQRFVDALLKPKAPTSGLKQAAKAHRRLLEPS
ncbi:DUF1778 domain-containing protein [Planctomicrobium sp. SH664]|uniref:type II toxin-antitoxin system TacA family antitoxin n=1 Tax=Planctomicrobium sp. SH664 TaxID=3448125 RepID=UPI003F5C1E8A